VKLTVPLYQEKFRQDGADVYYVRPLFHAGIEALRPELQRATDSVRNNLHKELRALSAQARHDSLAFYAQCPDVREEAVDVAIQLKRRSVEVRFLFAVFELGDRRVAFTPRLPHLSFDLGRRDDLVTRANEVLSTHYRKLEREQDDVNPAMDAMRGTGWIAHLDLNVNIDTVHVAPRKNDRAEIGGFTQMNGIEELGRVGRVLNALYPDDLDRAVRREALVTELAGYLERPDKRPLLLLGHAGVGKTALVHEVVHRRMAAKADNQSKQVWLISPQRLISGMSFVGQWENRVHAILSECKRRGHVLYFDDFIGLFRAGISASSRVSAAQVLKPHIEKHEVRLLVEMTPEEFGVLAELDRGFADLFHILRVPEPDADENLRILLHTQRSLEARHGCRFQSEVLPTALDLMQRYQREVAMPGKVAGFLQQLAVKHRGHPVTRMNALHEFESRSGLRVTFIDENIRLARETIQLALQRRIVGQEVAVNAMTDVVAITKARLNDPERPLGSLLFLGPTGVGKTECAKALAGYLFGNADRLLRFDMNEFVDAASVARLVGTLSEPEGLLTSAVRRRPFAVILLDEIEKAHPAAFDVLLQVLGEGRLTDALGRTADFSNCVIIMTSNLGVREAQGGLGVAGHEHRSDDAFVQAARRFFRPEFFNRIDRIVPFQCLSREQVGQIAQHLLQDVFAREGLARRRCVLQVDTLAMERVVDRGFHPSLGARAIKREIERQLTRPLSARLAELNPEAPTIVHLMARGEDVAVGLIPLEAATPEPGSVASRDLDDADGAIADIDPLLNRAEDVLETLRPQGAIPTEAVTPALARYFALRDQVKFVDNAVERFLDWRDQQDRRAPPVEASASRLSEQRPRRSQLGEALPVEASAWLDLGTPNELQAFLSAHAEDVGESEAHGRLRRLLASGALLNLLATRETQPDERALLLVRTVNGLPAGAPAELLGSWAALMRHRFDLGAEMLKLDQPGVAACAVSGYLSQAACGALAGLHLWCWEGGLLPLQTVAEPFSGEPVQAVSDMEARRRAWADAVAAGNASPDDDPMPAGKVVQVHFMGGVTLDVRSRQVSRERPSLSLLWTWLLSGVKP
jgi:ATP-dependent Clp protease ATP-binding subunit ClpC